LIQIFTYIQFFQKPDTALNNFKNHRLIAGLY